MASITNHLNNMITKYTPSRLDIQDVKAMSGYKAADIANACLKAISGFTVEQLKSADELPAQLVNAVTVLPRRVGRTRIVFMCYHNGKLLGSTKVDTSTA